MKKITDFNTVGQLIDAYLSGEKIQGMDFDQVNLLEHLTGFIYPIALDRKTRSCKRFFRGTEIVSYRRQGMAIKSKFAAQNSTVFISILSDSKGIWHSNRV